MNDKGRFLLLALVIAGVLLGGSVLYKNLAKDVPETTPAPVAEASPTADNRTVAPDFTVTTADGTAVAFSDVLALGKPVVINCWASWCPPCKGEMPDFEEIYLQYQDRVTFMMVNSTDGARETVETGQAFIEEMGYTFPVYFDTGSELAATYGITALPTSLFVDAEGYFVSGVRGAISGAQLQNRIDTLLGA